MTPAFVDPAATFATRRRRRPATVVLARAQQPSQTQPRTRRLHVNRRSRTLLSHLPLIFTLALALLAPCMRASSFDHDDDDASELSPALGDTDATGDQHPYAFHLTRPSLPRRLTRADLVRHTQRRRRERDGMHTLDAASDPSDTSAFDETLAGCPLADFVVAVRIGAGTDAQVFHLILDTGSTTVAVAGGTCAECRDAGVTPMYTPNTTAAARPLNTEMINMGYNDGTALEGVPYSDKVVLVNSRGRALTPPLQLHFAVLTNVSKGAETFFSKFACFAERTQLEHPMHQGLFGLGAQGLARGNTHSFVDQLYVQHPERYRGRMFTLQTCLAEGQLWLDYGDVAGTLTPGEVQQARALYRAMYAGRMRYTPLILGTSSWYKIRVTEFQVSRNRPLTPLPVSSSAGAPQLHKLDYRASIATVLDSGSSLWSLPQVVYAGLKDVLVGDGEFQRAFPELASILSSASRSRGVDPTAQCHTPTPDGTTSLAALQALAQRLPRLLITLESGVQLNLPGLGSYVIPCDAAQTAWRWAVVPEDDGRNLSVWGWPAMHHVVVQFDRARGRVGFASAVACHDLAPYATSSVPDGLATVTGGDIANDTVVGECGTAVSTTISPDERAACAPTATGTPSPSPSPILTPSSATSSTGTSLTISDVAAGGPPIVSASDGVDPLTGHDCLPTQCTGTVIVTQYAHGVRLGTCGCVDLGAQCWNTCAEEYDSDAAQSKPFTCKLVDSGYARLLMDGAQKCVLKAGSTTAASATSLSSTGLASLVDDLSISSSGASAPITLRSTDAVYVTLVLDFRYARVAADPDAFKASLLADLVRALPTLGGSGTTLTERIAQLRADEVTLEPSSTAASVTLGTRVGFLVLPAVGSGTDQLDVATLVASLEAQTASATSLLRTGTITSATMSMAQETRPRCTDASYASPCPSAVSGTPAAGADKEDANPIARFIRQRLFWLVVAGAIVTLVAATFLLHRLCTSAGCCTWCCTRWSTQRRIAISQDEENANLSATGDASATDPKAQTPGSAGTPAKVRTKSGKAGVALKSVTSKATVRTKYQNVAAVDEDESDDLESALGTGSAGSSSQFSITGADEDEDDDLDELADELYDPEEEEVMEIDLDTSAPAIRDDSMEAGTAASATEMARLDDEHDLALDEPSRPTTPYDADDEPVVVQWKS